MGSVPQTLPVPADTVVPGPASDKNAAGIATPDPPVPPARAARIAAQHKPEQVAWRDDRPVKIIIVGAGIGGVATAVLLSQKIKNATITVYDMQDRISGTWAANVYPGVRCDIPSHVYQLSFAPNRDWSEYYATGAEIQQYYERVVAQYGLTDRVRLRHRVVRATWQPAAAHWAVEVQNLAAAAAAAATTMTTIVDTADFFITAPGRISEPLMPAIPGLTDGTFQGRVVHTARWPPDLAYHGKRIAVIGAGASGLQLVSHLVAMQPSAAATHVDHYVRSKAWIVRALVGGFAEATADAPGGHVYTDAEKRAFHDAPGAYVAFRRALEVHMQRNALPKKDPEARRAAVLAYMRARLGGDEAWLARVTPDYVVGCKRPTPAPGYLEALVTPAADRVLSYITDAIVRVDATGVVTADGTHRPADMIVAATGFDAEAGYAPRFPVIGTDGTDLRDRWGRSSSPGYPSTYLGVMAPGVPNYFQVLQAQAVAPGASVPLQAEITATYIAKAIRKIQAQSYCALSPTQAATDEFNGLVDPYFAGSPVLGACRSWGKLDDDSGGARVVLSWPGSFQHRVRALREPRWEDFDFVRRRGGAQANRFEYFGNGQTDLDEDDEGEEGDDVRLTAYLREYDELDARWQHEWPE